MKFKEYLEREVYLGQKKINIIKKIYLKHINPSTNAVYLIRKMLILSEKNKGSIVSAILQIRSNFYQNRLAKKYGVYINPNLKIGIGLRLPHPNGIIIGAKEIGENCTIYQQVTIGSANIGDYKINKQPKIENGVIVFAGAKIIGNIVVSDSTVIGANAVLNKNTKCSQTYVGVPAKLINK